MSVGPNLAEDLNRWSLIYLGASLGGVALYVAVLWVWRSGRYPLPEDGLLALASWHPSVRNLLPYFLLVVIIIPASTIILAQVSAYLLMLVEDWSHDEAYAYQIGNLMHVETSTLHPQTHRGKAADLIVAALALTQNCSYVGLIISMGFVRRLTAMIPSSNAGFLGAMIDSWVFICFLCLYNSVFLWIIEGTDFVDCFLYMAGLVTGMHDQLTPRTPQTSGGKFWCQLCLSSELALVACILAIIGFHPGMLRLVILLEGRLETDKKFDFKKQQQIAEERHRKKEEAKIACLEAELKQFEAEKNGVGCPQCEETRARIRELEYRIEMTTSLQNMEDESGQKTPTPRWLLEHQETSTVRSHSTHGTLTPKQMELHSPKQTELHSPSNSKDQDTSRTEVDPRFSLSRATSVIIGREDTGTDSLAAPGDPAADPLAALGDPEINAIAGPATARSLLAPALYQDVTIAPALYKDDGAMVEVAPALCQDDLAIAPALYKDDGAMVEGAPALCQDDLAMAPALYKDDGAMAEADCVFPAEVLVPDSGKADCVFPAEVLVPDSDSEI